MQTVAKHGSILLCHTISLQPAKHTSDSGSACVKDMWIGTLLSATDVSATDVIDDSLHETVDVLQDTLTGP